MKRGSDDVTFSRDGQSCTCKWCGEPAIEGRLGSGNYACQNDPDCIVAHEAEMLEAQVQADEAKWLRVEQLRNP